MQRLQTRKLRTVRQLQELPSIYIIEYRRNVIAAFRSRSRAEDYVSKVENLWSRKNMGMRPHQLSVFKVPYISSWKTLVELVERVQLAVLAEEAEEFKDD